VNGYHYFSESSFYQDPPITHIFAAYKRLPKPYIRCKQTCKPLADYLKIPIDTSYQPTQIDKLAKEILANPKYNDRTVLICWDHYHIPSLIKAFGAEEPGTWDNDIYDQVYVLTFQKDAKPQVQKILQQLMYGDRTTFSASLTALPEIAAPCPKED